MKFMKIDKISIMNKGTFLSLMAISAFLFAFLAVACNGEDSDSNSVSSANEFTLYSGRSEKLIGPIIAQFEEDTGINVRVRYGKTAELAAQLLEEGTRTPADAFLAQDAGALGAIENASLFQTLDSELSDGISEKFKSRTDAWVGVSGRGRVLVYSTEQLEKSELPSSIFELVEPKWKGQVGWAPTNGSFQAFVTALRVIEGEEKAKMWLQDMIANEVQVYPKNTPIVQAAGNGEIKIGLVNHYYLYRFLAEDPDFPAANHFSDTGGSGALVNVAGIGLMKAAGENPAALHFIKYLLAEKAQSYFASETNEYPLNEKISPRQGLPLLSELSPPTLDLSSISDLQGTIKLLSETGALP